MLHKLPIVALGALALAWVATACNDKSETDPEVQAVSYANVGVESFSLAKNDSVVAYLDSVFFSIDLESACIYNADSLPVGTDISRLVVNIGLPSLSEATLIQSPDASGERVQIDYLASTTDSIDFSLGPVTLHLVSYDGEAQRDYRISVNVHRVEPDSLCWGSMALSALPGAFDGATAQKTVKCGDRVWTLVTGPSEARISHTADPSAGAWTTLTPDLPSGAVTASLQAAAGSLYILDSTGALYSSADGQTWTPASLACHWLIGEYNGELLTVSPDCSATVLYPSGVTAAIPQGMPVDHMSSLLAFDTPWAVLPQAMFVGGRDASGALSASSWGYDGSEWACLSIDPMPQGMEGMALMPYFSFQTASKTWAVTEHTTLLAFGGRLADGSIDRTVYRSLDRGLRWSVADDLMQLPTQMSVGCDAQALVLDMQYEASAKAAARTLWTEIPCRKPAPWLMVMPAPGTSRAVEPVTSWECPYIYLFGGVTAQAELLPQVWRGVINRLTFKPLQ